MTTVYIVSFYANITTIGTRSYHCRFTQSKPDKESHVAILRRLRSDLVNPKFGSQKSALL